MPDVNCIKDAFQRCCEISIVVNGQQSETLSNITEEKIDEVHDIYENFPLSSVQVVITACFIPGTITGRIMTEYLPMKPCKVQFIQQLHKEDLQGRIEI
ncbi:unnamed protein product [Rotaria sp. Silwood2]|nr:unnamed protein product [Rotaria sp. Silwood2]CAF4199586.1 unnamed protein product [Rotaria sp. Silwood2]CAF4551603.1 unnamed protein product [Rotaria sp. Silwood2]CAF4727857.1 unnamed protein product [Rotaria sp. Silwood2]